jgi:dTDP-4-dehydrorhamnose reductase
MKIAVLGSTGMLGHKMVERLQEHFPNVTTPRIDAEEPMDCGHIRADRPDVVVNCVGVIKQRVQNPRESIAVNALFPHNLQRACRQSGAYLIHYSTDCVFSGKDGDYKEDSKSDAEDLYGITKYLGEVTGPNTLTLRTSIIGRETANYHGLLEWFLRQKGDVKGYTNAIFSGVTTNWLASLTAELIYRRKFTGLYQVATRPVSKFHLLETFKSVYGKTDVNIIPMEYPRCDRSLNSEKFRRDTQISIPELNMMIINQAYKDRGRYGAI